ncbi:MAG: ion transporter [Leptolyngbya sp. SIO1D8]|nr:ion transporter [Leptolyngbya sp. SIO1D8]
MMTLKEQIAAYLDDTNRETGGWVTGAISALIFLSVIIFVVETYEISPQFQSFLTGLDWLILALFTGEYLLRLWTAEQWWAYALSPYGVVDLIAISPFVLGMLDMRFVRLLRWLRVLRLVRFLGDRALLGRLTPADTLAVIRIVFTLFAIIFIYAGIIFQVEQRYHPDTFVSFLDAAYFAVVTMTTVGYGDITPVSDVGRLFTILMILTGIALIPTQLGDLIRRIVKVSQAVQMPCPHCGWPMHDPDAQFCKRCGTALSRAQTPLNTVGLEPESIESSLPFAPRSIMPFTESTETGPPASPPKDVS